MPRRPGYVSTDNAYISDKAVIAPGKLGLVTEVAVKISKIVAGHALRRPRRADLRKTVYRGRCSTTPAERRDPPAEMNPRRTAVRAIWSAYISPQVRADEARTYHAARQQAGVLRLCRSSPASTAAPCAGGAAFAHHR